MFYCLFNAMPWTDIKQLECVRLCVCLSKYLSSTIVTAVLSNLPQIWNVGDTSDNED